MERGNRGQQDPDAADDTAKKGMVAAGADGGRWAGQWCHVQLSLRITPLQRRLPLPLEEAPPPPPDGPAGEESPAGEEDGPADEEDGPAGEEDAPSWRLLYGRY